MNQILSMEKFSVPHVGLISCDLRHPVAVRIMGYAATPDFPCEYIFKEEQMKALQRSVFRDDFMSAEIRGRYVFMTFEEEVEI